MTDSTRPRRWLASRWLASRRRPAAVVPALALIVATLAIATAARPVPLAEVLLVVLVEVVAVSLVAGRTTAAVTAVATSVAVNWLLVAPYGTLVIAEEQNWITLGVFLLMAVGVSSLVESVVTAERNSAAAAAREAAVAQALRPAGTSAAEALAVLRTALLLEVAALVDTSTGEVVLSGAQRQPAEPATLEVPINPHFRVVGWGPPVLGSRPEYVRTLATATVRAWESQRLAAEQQRSAELAAVDAARGALLASIGHDLRTPLAGIRVSADALAMGGELSDADREELLTGLRASAVRLDTLLDAVLDVARMESGAVRAQARATDLRAVLAAAAADFPSDRLELGIPADPVPARVDPVITERIVANLLANALTHTPPDRPVLASCAVGGVGPTITIADHGPGLVPDAIDTGRSPHGMGLLIVDRLANFAGIRIDRYETPGGGLTVALEVPS